MIKISKIKQSQSFPSHEGQIAMMIVYKALNHKFVATHAFIQPAGNTGNSGRAQPRFFRDLGIRHIFAKHARCFPSFAKFNNLLLGQQVAQKLLCF